MPFQLWVTSFSPGRNFSNSIHLSAMRHIVPLLTRHPTMAVQRRVEQPRTHLQSFILSAVKVLLVLVILFLLPELVSGNKRNRKRRRRDEMEIRTVRSDCAIQVCKAVVVEESMNCVLSCISPACYNRVYEDEPLEDGEIDVRRARDFEDCLKDEFRTLRERRWFLDRQK